MKYGFNLTSSLLVFLAIIAQVVPASEQVPPGTAAYPRIAMMWASIRNDRTMKGLAQHDLIMISPGRLGMKYNQNPAGLSDGFTAESVQEGRKRLAELRELNPRAIVIADIPFYEYNDSWLPEEHAWWLRKDGKRQQFWPGTHRMDWYNADYRKKVARQTAACKEAGFDGVFYDNLRQEKEPWIEFLKEVRAQAGDSFLLMANCGYDVGGFDWIAPWLNGIMYESGWSHKRTEWDDCIRKMRHTETLLRQPRVSIIERFENIDDHAGWPNDAKKGKEAPRDPAARHWSLCYALIVGDFYYLFSDSTSHQHDWYPEYDVKIGQPTADPVRVSSHVWKRQYDQATVIVNLPGASEPYEVKLEKAAQDTLTSENGTQFSIPPGEGRILRAVSER
jgi:hypothetical protein